MTEVNCEFSTPNRKPVQLCNCDVVRQFENNVLSAIEGGEGLDVGILVLDQGEVLDRCRKGKNHQVLRLVQVAWFTTTKTLKQF